MEKYCYKCGSETKLKETGLFNTQTGIPTTYSYCPNSKCEEGCKELGHPGKPWWSNKCNNCGVDYSNPGWLMY